MNAAVDFYFQKLTAHYEMLESLTSRMVLASPENPCGICHSCCTYPIRLQVSGFELQYIRKYFPRYDEDRFVAFINKTLPEKSICPNYDTSTSRCQIYAARPMCCRIFGYVPFRSLRDDCSFQQMDKSAVSWKDVDNLFLSFAELRLGYFQAHRNMQLRTVVDFLTMGNIFVEEGDNEEGFQFYDKAIAVDRGSALAHSYAARKYELLQDLSEAEKAYGKAIELDPEDPVLLLKLGFLYQIQGRLEEAVKQYEEAVRRMPYSQIAFSNMGMVFTALNQKENALKAYGEACRIDPSNITNRIMRGNLLLQLERAPEALQEYLAAHELDPNDPLPCLCAGNACKKISRFEEAIHYFEECHTRAENPELRRVVENELQALKSGIPGSL